MSEARYSSSRGGLILLGVGILSLLAGFALIMERTSFAGVFLGARFLFDSPASDVDRLKVLCIQGGGILMIGQSAVLLLAGLFQLVRGGAVQGTAVKPIGH